MERLRKISKRCILLIWREGSEKDLSLLTKSDDAGGYDACIGLDLAFCAGRLSKSHNLSFDLGQWAGVHQIPVQI